MNHIYDPDILEKIIAVEGEAFRDLEKTRAIQAEAFGYSRQYSLAWAIEEWREDNSFSGTIYGVGGWHRFFVREETGEVVFSAHHCSNKSIYPKVLAAGFRISC